MGAEYVELLLEQGGFHPSQPVLPRTAKLPEDFKVVIIGAGIAGMAAALECAAAGIDYEIIDRNDEVGGTWYTAVYPGIGVDTPSAYYSLSRDIKGDWSSYYPQGGEYQAYLESVADKNKLRERTRFGTEVEALWWDEDREQWQVHAVGPDGTREVSYANVVIPAAGYLNRPRWPELDGPGHLRRHQHPLRAVGSEPWISPARRWRSSVPAAPRCRSSTPASIRSST